MFSYYSLNAQGNSKFSFSTLFFKAAFTMIWVFYSLTLPLNFREFCILAVFANSGSSSSDILNINIKKKKAVELDFDLTNFFQKYSHF